MTLYFYRVGIALSILFNTMTGGETNQTFSARNYEWKRNKKFNIVKYIDMVLGAGHCLECWITWYTRLKVNKGSK